MHIGLIGGIGPAATVVYYQRLCDGARARGVPLDLTIVQADAPTLVANNLADDRDAQAAIYAGLIDRLKAAGADCAAITSLGGHFCYEETLARASLPLVSGVEPLDAHFAEQGLGTVGLLGTEVVMRTRLYGQLSRTQALAPQTLPESGARYLSMALAGRASDEDRRAFFSEGSEMIARGAEAIVLAGTDLGLAFDGHDPGYRVIDALDVHVARLLDLACGQAAL
ncbi:MAG: aspartate/glutamate racemase family protein [Pseudomonadota bacterium]